MNKLLRITALFILSSGVTTYAQSTGESRLGMDRDSYGVYDRAGGLSCADYPYLMGQAYKPRWDSNLNPSRNNFNWSELDERLKQAYEQKQRLYIQVHVSYKDRTAPPEWVYKSGVPMVKGAVDTRKKWAVNIKKSKPKESIYPYWLDSNFITYYKEMVAALGTHLRNEVPSHLQKIISFVRVDCGIHGDDRPYDVVSSIPAKYKISKSEWMDFKFMAFETYKKAFQEGAGPIIPLMFKHAAPKKYKAEWNWIQQNIKHSYGVRYLGDVRGHHFTASQLTTDQFRDMAVDSDAGIFSRNEMDRAWLSPMAQKNLPLYFYWTAVEQLHPGLSIWDILRGGVESAEKGKYEFAFDFFNRWAAELVPATAGGGFCIFHEGLDASDTEKFPVKKYGKAVKNNKARYEAICNDPIYAARGAKMDCPEFATKWQVMQHRTQTGYNDSGWEIVPGNYERFITQLKPEETSIGLFRVNGELTGKSHHYDRFARSFEHASGKTLCISTLMTILWILKLSVLGFL